MPKLELCKNSFAKNDLNPAPFLWLKGDKSGFLRLGKKTPTINFELLHFKESHDGWKINASRLKSGRQPFTVP